jgi:plastocyanin
MMRSYVLVLVCLASACGSEKTGPTTSSDSATGADEGAATDTNSSADDTESPTEDADSTSGATVTVHAGSYYYKPASITIKVGDTVQWIWDGGTHSVTSGASCTPDGKFDSNNHSAPYTYKRTFTEAGTFAYHCKYMSHCEMGQKGTVVVTP